MRTYSQRLVPHNALLFESNFYFQTQNSVTGRGATRLLVGLPSLRGGLPPSVGVVGPRETAAAHCTALDGGLAQPALGAGALHFCVRQAFAWEASGKAFFAPGVSPFPGDALGLAEWRRRLAT